jgi:putative endonuclease
MSSEHLELGKRGEDIACRYLKDKGYKIRERNWKLGRNEIDLIAQDGEFIVIVEVKTRTSNIVAEPETSVTREKQRILVRAANAYIRYFRLSREVRFDIVAILLDGEKEIVKHIPDAFYPML